jgi:DNA primase
MGKTETKYICDAIKKEHSLISYVKSVGIEVHERSGRNFIICPFHNDNDPSMVVSDSGKCESFYCFGCKASGSIIDFYAKYNNISIGQAIHQLSQGMNFSFDLSSIVSELNSKEEKDESKEVSFINAMISSHCRDYLSKIKNKYSNNVLKKEFDGIENIYRNIDLAIIENDIDILKNYYNMICLDGYLIERFKKIG